MSDSGTISRTDPGSDEAPPSALERFFSLRERGTSVGTEVLAGITTFMVMAYIIFVNPAILTFASAPALQGQGPPFPATLAATCLVAALTTIAMGLYSNYPFALAPGLGLNAVVAFTLIAGLKLPWQAAMGVIFMEGLLITLLVLTGFREAVMRAIPISLKKAISVGIGLFILFIGLEIGELIIWGSRDIGTPVAISPMDSPRQLVTIVGLAVTLLLFSRGIRGSLLWGILGTTVFAVIVNGLTGNTAFTIPGMATLPTAILSAPDFSTIGQGINFGVFGQIGILAAVLTIFSLMLSDFFDTMGTVIGVGGEAGLLDKQGQLPGLNRVLLVDSVAAMLGGAFSTSSATTYIESAAGVSQGARTGLSSVVVGVLFLAALFLSPIAAVVPPHATAPTLIIVGFLMAGLVREIPFDDIEEGFPALVTIALMPFTFSITNGIGAGFIAYAFIKVIRGKAGEVHPLLYGASLAFAVYFALGPIRSALGL
ncbi:MAG TPA: NCS2 family permease [Chloroflexota bacterium]|jgi:adenine/guanine/hypoxanthine permease|nr:NCS2 family permease [Chloroflexota bacterium]